MKVRFECHGEGTSEDICINVYEGREGEKYSHSGGISKASKTDDVCESELTGEEVL